MKYLNLLILLLFSLNIYAQEGADKLKDQPDGLYAEMITDQGSILLFLEHEKVPMTVANFVGLAEGKIENKAKPLGTPFYDGIVFHRVIANFMIQAGDPQSNGMGGPGYKFPDEIHPDLKHSGPGILSMANAGPGTNGSQFFITHKETPWLDGKHTVFGHVVEGQKVVDVIFKGDVIQQVKIYRKGKSAEEFDAPAVFEDYTTNWEQKQKEKQRKELEPWIAEMQETYKKAKITDSGLMYIIEEKGKKKAGMPEVGKKVKVHYTGYFLDGSKFDSSLDRNQPFEFTLGQGQVIKGWDEGIAMLYVGSKAKLIIPYQMAYGPAGRPPTIPAKATLIFDVELLEVESSEAK